MPEKVYTVKDAAKLLGYSTNTLYSYLKKGEIKSIRVGKGKFRIPQSEMDRLLGTEKPVIPFVPVQDIRIPAPSEAPSTLLETEPTPIEVKAGNEPIYKTMVVREAVLPTPRPGKSLADLSSDKPFYTIRLWLEERVGLPKLFDWFVSLSSIVLGMSMFLYTKQLDSLVIGQFTDWFTPIRLTLILGGFGLVLADMIQEEFPLYRNLNHIFRYILVFTYGAMSAILFKSSDYDGFLIYGLFALVIFLENILGFISSTAYMLYIQGLMLGIALIFRFLPFDSGLSTLSKGVYSIIDGQSWILDLLVVSIILSTLIGYFFDKKVLKITLGISGVLLTLLSFYYANNSYWSAAFFILVTGMIGVLLPFWEQFKVKSETDRTLMFKMFGTIVMAFSLVVVILGIVQQILLNNAVMNLTEKADYGRLSIDYTSNNVLQTLAGLSQNDLFFTALSQKTTTNLDSFLKAVFSNSPDLQSVVIVNKTGDVLSVYPLSTDISKSNFARSKFFTETVFNKNNYFSRSVDVFTPTMSKAILAAVPVFDNSNNAIGAALASLNLATLGVKMQQITVEGIGQYLTIVDDNGRWLVNPDPNKVGQIVDETDATSLLFSRQKGQQFGYDANGKYAIFISEKTKVANWSVVVSQPISTIMDISKSGFIVILFMLMASVATIFFSFVFSSKKEYAQI